MRGMAIPLAACLLLAGCGHKRPPGPLLAHDKPLSHWLTALHDPDWRVRKKAVLALAPAATADAAVVPALIQAMGDRQKEVRVAAILSLLNIGRPAKEAIRSLEELQNDEDPAVRSYATKALERIRGK